MRRGLFLALLFSAIPVWAAQVTLAENGKAGYVILTAARPSVVERFAAEELARYLKQISGADFPVMAQAPQVRRGQRGGSKKKQAPAIWLGREPAASRGVRFTDTSALNDELRMRADSGELVLAGATDRATLYSVYAFLERLGCRWFAPNYDFYGDAGGEVVPRLSRIALEPFDVTERPSFKYRKKYVEEGRSHNVRNLKQMIDWLAKVRANVFNCPLDYQRHGRAVWDNWRGELLPELKKRGFLVEVGGHGYQNFLPQEKYFDQHPEWFGLWNGARSREPGVVFATSNAQATEAFLGNVVAYLEAHPEIDIFDLWPPDGARWSQAPEDEVLGPPAMRHALVVNRVADAVREKFPRLKVEFIAYSSYLEAPAGVVFRENTVMDFCPINRSFEAPLFDESVAANKMYMDALRTWLAQPAKVPGGDISLYSYYPKFAWRSLPISLPRLVAQEAPFFLKLGLHGWDSYSEPGNWFSYEAQHYMVARASWNAGLDAEQVLADYAGLRYGAAAQPVAEFLKMMEETLVRASRVPGTAPKTPEQLREYEKRMERGGALLDRAAKLAAGTPAAALIEKLELTRQYALLEVRLRLAYLDQAQRFVRGGSRQITALLEARKKLFDDHRDRGIFFEHPTQNNY